MIAAYARWWWAEVRGWATSLGYMIRPYDMLADRRRWFWQPRTPCGSSLWRTWNELPYKHELVWRRPTIVRVTAADPHWRFVLNRYPGVVIGVAVYLGRWRLSLLWARPGRVIYTETGVGRDVSR